MAAAATVALAAAGLIVAASWCAEAEEIVARYAVEWGSLPVAEIAFDTHQQEGRYRAGYAAKASGVLGFFWPFEARWTSEGEAHGAGLQPERLEALSVFRDQERHVLMEFDDSGRVTRFEATAEESGERDAVPDAMRNGPDPISLALSTIEKVGLGSRHVGQSFDGRRVVASEISCPSEGGKVELGSLPPAEKTLRCDLDGRVVAGGWRRTGPRRVESQGPIRLWLATRPGVAGWWPVRMEADTSMGMVTARLTEWSSRPGG
jgi:hypothetical protein